MKFNTKRMDVIANNLANVNTNGFKRDITVAEIFPEMLTKRLNDVRSPSNPSGRIGMMELSSDVGEIYTYYNQGSLIATNNNLDFSIHDNGNSFFTIALINEQGEVVEAYTRDGAFVINGNNLLVTKDGYPVMGENGPITIYDKGFIVEEDGTIIQNGEVTGRFLIRSFVDPTTLRKVGNNLIVATEGSQIQPFNGTIKQGFLEQSNVNVVKEMVDMITVMRAYEASQKMVQIQDETLGKAVNEIGRVG